MNAKDLKHYLFTGFIMLLPVVLTFWVISILLSFLTTPFMGFTERLLELMGLHVGSFLIFTGPQVLTFISQLLSLIFLLVVITFVGAVGRYLFFRSILHVGDSIIQKIPVISSVYKTSRELISTLFAKDNRAFKQVVLVPFPHPHSLAVGFMTRSDPVLDDRIAVFIPTTPNPTAGFLLFFEPKDVMVVNMKVDEALRFVVSCGVLLDKKSSLLHLPPREKGITH